jgi:Glycosyl hydrolase family 26
MPRCPLRAALPLAFSATCLVAVVHCGSSGPAPGGAPPAGGGSGNEGGASGGSGGGAGSRGGSDDSGVGPDDSSTPATGGDDGGPEGSTATTQDGAAPAADAGAANILVPAQGVLLGEYYGDGTITATEQRIGRRPNIHLTYYGWTEDWTTDSVPTADFAAGRIPLVNLEPDNVDFTDIVSGSLDATIRARASGSKKLGHPFFLDFAAEMNGDEAWSGNDPALYVAAYRHIHDLFVAAGATNVIWAWCPNVTDTSGGNAMTMAYYPGDDYVDWTGVDGYNWGTSDPNFAWQSFHDVFKDIYPLLAARGKPILIGEMASDEVGGSKSQWIADMIPTLRADFPSIKAFVWFDVKKERDWEIDSSPSSLSAYATLAADPFTNP